MCLLNPTGASCACPEGKTLVNGTCIDPNVSGQPHVLNIYIVESKPERFTGGHKKTEVIYICLLLSSQILGLWDKQNPYSLTETYSIKSLSLSNC